MDFEVGTTPGGNVKKKNNYFRRNELRAGVFKKNTEFLKNIFQAQEIFEIRKLELNIFCKYNLIQFSPPIQFLQLRNRFESARPKQH